MKKERGECVAAGKLVEGLALTNSVLLTVWLFLAELLAPFRAVNRAQVGLFRKLCRCSKGPTHLQSFCKNVQVLAGGEMEAEVLLESFPCLLGCSLLLFPGHRQAQSGLAVPTVKVSETLFTGSQDAVSEAIRQRVTVGSDPALSRQIQECMGWMSENMGWLVPEAGCFWIRSSVPGKPPGVQSSHGGSAGL